MQLEFRENGSPERRSGKDRRLIPTMVDPERDRREKIRRVKPGKGVSEKDLKTIKQERKDAINWTISIICFTISMAFFTEFSMAVWFEFFWK